MRKQTKAKGCSELPVKNPVAKFAHQFNKSQIYADKRQYRRKDKHQGLEPCSTALTKAFEQDFMALAVQKAAYSGFPAQ